ncbi:unnamed protein product [Closterium sp. NIES-54]
MAMSRWGLDKLLRSRSSDKLVSLLLPDGSMEMFGGGKTVADIMAEYPGHHVGSITSSRPCLTPEKSLHPGSTYYLEPKQSPLKGAKSLPSNEDFKGFLPDSDRNDGPAPRRARKETRKAERQGDFLTENVQNGFVPRRMSLDTGALFSRQQSADVAALAAAVAASSSMRHSDYVFDATSEDDEEEMISPFQAANRVASRHTSVSDASSARSAAASLSEARQLWQDETNMRRHSQPKRVNSLNDLSNYGGYNNGGYDNGGGYDSEFNGYNAAVGQQSPAFSQLERQPSCGRSCGGCGAGGSMRSSLSPSPAPSVRSASAAAFPDFEGGDIARGFSALDSADCATGGRSGRRALHRGAGSAQDGSTRPAFPDYDASAAAAACGLVPSPSPPPPGLAQWQQQQSFSRSASHSRNDSREYDSQRDPRPAPRARFPSAPSTPVRRTSLDHRAMRANLPHPADASAFVASLRGGSPADARSVFTAIDSDSESQCDDGEIADEEGTVKSGYSLPSPHDAGAAEERRREREKREWMVMQRHMMRQQHMQHQQQRQQQMQYNQMQQFQQQQMHFQQQQQMQQMFPQQRASSPRLHHQYHNQQQQQPRLSRRSANSASGRSARLPPRAVSPLPPIPANHVSPPNSCDFLCSPGAAPGSLKSSEMRDGGLITEDSRSRSCASLSSLSAEFVVPQQSSGMSSWGSYPSLESLSPEGTSLATSSPRNQL